MTISNWMAALALVNGTTGGVVLVLPIIGLDAGWLMIPVLIFIASLCCYYTATLMFMHLGNSQTINKSIMNHFASHKYCQFYNFTMFASFFGEMILYFDLLVSESQGCFYFAGEAIKPCIPYFVAIFLILLVLVTRMYHFEDSLLGYGILSMIAYAMSMMTKKQGPNSLAMVDRQFIDLGAAMSQGFSIHNMMIPIILRAQNPQDYKKILANVFTISAILYTFIAYGSVALVNRVPINGVGQTVQDYFMNNEWKIYVLRAIYIINIVTVFPEFVSISKIRFFNLFCEEDTAENQEQLTFREGVYLVVVVGVCLVSKILKFRAPLIIQLNGSIICFMQIYLIPIAIHLRCIYMTYKDTDQTQYAIEHVNIQSQHGDTLELKKVQDNNNGQTMALQDRNVSRQHHKSSLVQSADLNVAQPEGIDDNINERCRFHEELSVDKHLRTKEVIKSLIVLFYGLFVMMFTFYTVFFKKES